MPKKTKKQKILAEYRRKLKQLELNAPSPKTDLPSSQPATPQTLSQPSSKPVSLSQEKTSATKLEYDKSLFLFTLADLKKTFFVTLFVLALEFLVFYVNLKGISFIRR
jgi:hypothetical protein